MNRAVLAFFAFAFAPASALAASPADVMKSLCAGPNALPIEVAGSRHFVSVTLAGPKQTELIRFHVDSGGSMFGLLIRRAAATRLGFTTAESLPRTLRMAGRDIAIPPEAVWYISDQPDPRGEHFAEAQIGAVFFGAFVVCIDPAAGQLGLGDPRQVEIKDDGTSLPLQLHRLGPRHAPYPFLRVRIDPLEFPMLLDTGATSTMIERPTMDALRAAHPDWPSFTGAAGDADMLGSHWLEHLLHASAASLGRRPLGPVLLVDRPGGTWPEMFGVNEARGALANDVLNRFKMLIDYVHSKLWLWPSGRAADVSASMTRVGLSVEYGSDGCPVVRAISTTNAAETMNQVQTGDVVVRVDDLDVCGKPHYVLATALAGMAGQKKRLRVRRGKVSTDLVLPTANLLAPR